jgi:hypothetical protein
MAIFRPVLRRYENGSTEEKDIEIKKEYAPLT